MDIIELEKLGLIEGVLVRFSAKQLFEMRIYKDERSDMDT